MITWVFLLPFAGALAAFLVGRRFEAAIGGLAVSANLAAAVLVAALVWNEGVQHHTIGGWGAPLGIVLTVDGLSAVMLLLTAFVAVGVTVYAMVHLRKETTAGGEGAGEELFWPLWLFLLAALNGVLLSGDIFNLYVLLELVGLSAIALASLAGKPDALVASMRYLLATMVASMFYLAGVALLYAGHHSLDIATLATTVGASGADRVACAFMVLGLLVKTALFPLHFWLPPAHANAIAPVSAVLSALVVKASFFILVRLWVSVFAGTVTVSMGQLLGALGAAAILWGSIQAMRQVRLKLLIAHSTVAQIGYLFLLFPLITVEGGLFGAAASWAPMAWTGTFFQVLAHALAKAAMFLAAGVIMLALGTDRLEAMHGTAGRLPMTTLALGLAGVTLIGLPPSGGFIAKWLLLQAVIESGQWWWAPVLVSGSLLTAGYVFLMLAYTFQPREDVPPLRAVPRWLEGSALGLALAAILVSFQTEQFLQLLSTGMPFSPEAHPQSPSDFAAAGFWMPLAIVGSSLVTAVAILFLREEQSRLRTIVNLGGAALKLVLIVIVALGVLAGRTYEARFQIVLGFDFLLRIDSLALLFTMLSAVLWFVTTVYAIGYLEGAPNRRRFFSFFSLCVTASVGVALAGNLITFFIFYEFLTLATYPLVVHRGTPESLRAGRTYLSYTLAGGIVLFVGVVWLHSLAGPFDFGQTHVLAALAAEHGAVLTTVVAILLLGLGVKAAIVPLHGWLPVAMVAPAPVSALLHAVAVVKAGAFGIVRVVYDVFGVSLAAQLKVLAPLAGIAAVTIIYGSLRALTQDDLKRRLAYSTVSQLSYIVLGVATVGPIATIGALMHLVHQGVMKITLFFCAGNLAETLHIHKVSEMAGVGRRMPWTMAAFTVAALAMIGVPPLAGFISKWYLGLGGLAAGNSWVMAVLLVSTVLNAGYFLPIIYAAWFKEPTSAWKETEPFLRQRFECSWLLLAPPLVTALLAVAMGVFAASPFSPMYLARQISAMLHAP